MNAFLNYLLEANLGLLLFYVVYATILRHETDFRIKRVYILSAILASLVFPLLHFSSGNNLIPSLSTIIPVYWLPEVVITAGSIPSPEHEQTFPQFAAWNFIFILYGCGVVVMLILFLCRLTNLLFVIRRSTGYAIGAYKIIESEKNQSSFSFFHYIFIGYAHKLSSVEKQQIIKHELVHAKYFHSFDILLINILSIFFWFNPILMLYKKIFVQLHEFEADARAVENSDMNDYCSLLARVALLSADFKLANHFSNSLTVKRIEMMRTIKTKITRWKLVAMAIILPLFFFIVACQDQVTQDVVDIVRNSNHPFEVPENVQVRYDQLKKENPNANYVLVELNEEAQKQLADMEAKYGLPKSIEIYKTENGEWITGKSDSGVIVKSDQETTSKQKTLAIIEYNEQMKQIGEASKMEGDIFTVVEESAGFEGGFEALGTFIGQNLKYPEASRQAKKEGTVFIRFVVNQDGTLSDFVTMKGVDPLMDNEALRVAQLLPKWNPGKQNGKAVRQQFVLPIRFSLGQGTNESSSEQVREVQNNFKFSFKVDEKANEKIVTGKILDENGDPVKGAHVINVGSSHGTTTDDDGNFKIAVAKTSGQLAVSFVGYKTEKIPY